MCGDTCSAGFILTAEYMRCNLRKSSSGHVQPMKTPVSPHMHRHMWVAKAPSLWQHVKTDQTVQMCWLTRVLAGNTKRNTYSHITANIAISLDKSGYHVNIFLISP